jgi:hypothetical protein
LKTRTTAADDLFFEPLVRRYVDPEQNPRFIRRDWLAAALQEKLEKPGTSFVLLTAQPGAGKSAFMAQLAYDHPEWPRYFIRHDQRTVLADVSTKSLLLRIGYQLAARKPELFATEQLRLSVIQRVGEVAHEGEVIGATVKRLIASPFYQKVVRIQQQVGTNHGKVVGLQVEELVVETRLLKPEDLLELALIYPALALRRISPTERIVILIDALDEIRYQQAASNILDLLANCDRLPENVRFVLTSRPRDEALKYFCEKQALYLSELEINAENAHVKHDIKEFVTGLINEDVVAQLLAETARGAKPFAELVTEKARGNLGYLDALARGIDRAVTQMQDNDEATRVQGRRALDTLLSLRELPADLNGLYAFFFHQIKHGVARERVEVKDTKSDETYDKEVWPTIYNAILGVLAVAMAPVDLELLVRLGRIHAEPLWVRNALNRLAQFLDIADGLYRLYHATVAEFLTAQSTETNPDTADLYQEPKGWHGRIAMSYWNAREGQWQACDQYGLRYLARHLAEAEDVSRLQQLIAPERQPRNSWYATKAAVGDLDNWEVDIECALGLAEKMKAVPLQVRCALCLSSVKNLKAPPPLLDLCLQEKVLDWAQALTLAKLIENPVLRSRAMCHLAMNDPKPEHESVIAEQFEVGCSVLDDTLRVSIWVALAPCLPETHFGKLLSAAKRIKENRLRAKVILEYAGRMSAPCFSDALQMARAIGDPLSKLRSLAALTERQPSNQTLLREVRSAMVDMEPNYEQVIALCKIGCCLRGKEQNDLLADALTIARHLDYSTGLALALAGFGRTGVSEAQIADVVSLAESIYRNEDTPGTRDGYVYVLTELGPFLSESQRENYVGKLVTILREGTSCFNVKIADGVVPLLVPYLPKDRQSEACAKYVRFLIQGYERDLFGLSRGYENRFSASWRNNAKLRALELWPEHLLDSALDEVLATKEDEPRAEFLRVIIKRLPKERRAPLLRGELDRVAAIGDKGARAKALAALVGNVPANERATIVEEALHACDAILPHEMRLKSIALLVPHVTLERKASVLERALEAVRKLNNDRREQSKALAALAACLPDCLIPAAVEIAQSLDNEAHLAKSSLAARLCERDRVNIIEFCLNAVEGVVTCELPQDCVQVLQALAPYLRPDQVIRAMAITKKIPLSNEREIALALAALAHRLCGVERDEAFKMAQDLSQIQHKVHAMAAFDRGLTCLRSEAALSDAFATREDNWRAEKLSKLLPFLSGDTRSQAFTTALRSCLGLRIVLAVGSTSVYRRIDREFLLDRIADMADTFTELSGERGAAQVAFAIIDTATWWP